MNKPAFLNDNLQNIQIDDLFLGVTTIYINNSIEQYLHTFFAGTNIDSVCNKSKQNYICIAIGIESLFWGPVRMNIKESSA